MSQDVQNKAQLEKGRDELEKRGDAPGPVAGNVVCAEADGCCDNLADKVGDVEERRQDGALFGVGEFADERGA